MTDATNKTADGCVSCTETPPCPICDDDEYCVMTSLTCSSCPSTYCTAKSSSQFSSLSNSTNSTTTGSGTSQIDESNGHVTKIVVGSVIGGIAALIIVVGLLIYQWYWKPRRKNFDNGLELKDDMDMLDMDDDDDDDSDDDIDDSDLLDNDGMGGSPLPGHDAGEHMMMNNHKDRVAQYEDIIHLRDLGKQKPHSRALRSMLQPGNRLSTTSTIKTNASNLLPIAYIPGVTSAGVNGNGNGRKPNLLSNSRAYSNYLNIPGDTGSHITLGSSILGGLDEGFDDDSMFDALSNVTGQESGNGSTDNIQNGNSSRVGTGNNLTTAIKAKPKLVQIAEESDDEDIYEQSEQSGSYNTTSERLHNIFDDENENGDVFLDLDIADSILDVASTKTGHQEAHEEPLQKSSLDPNTSKSESNPFDDTFEVEYQD